VVDLMVLEAVDAVAAAGAIIYLVIVNTYKE
jgi:hypothetical protein